MPDSRILRFNAPPTWPTPDIEWQSVYAGWKPLTNWTPIPGAVPAPLGWTFWVPLEPGWSEVVSAHRAKYRPWAVIGGAFSVVGLLLFIAESFGPAANSSRMVMGGLIVWGAIVFVRNMVATSRVPDVVMTHLEKTAPERIEAYDRARYANYLKLEGAL